MEHSLTLTPASPLHTCTYIHTLIDTDSANILRENRAMYTLVVHQLYTNTQALLLLPFTLHECVIYTYT